MVGATPRLRRVSCWQSVGTRMRRSPEFGGIPAEAQGCRLVVSATRDVIK
jgi:hypothetical protein